MSGFLERLTGTAEVDGNAELTTRTAELLDDIRTFLARFIVYPSRHELTAHALWIAHAWLMDCWESTPRIAFLSPDPAAGSHARWRSLNLWCRARFTQ